MKTIEQVIDSVWLRLKKTVRRSPCRIVLPEGDDVRIIKASEIIVSEHIAAPVILGDPKKIRQIAGKEGISLTDIEIIQPSQSPDRNAFIELLMALRTSKGLTRKDAEIMVDDNLVHGCLMLKTRKVNGFVGGASRTSADTLRAGITIVGVDSAIGTVSGAFIVKVPDSQYGNNGWFVYADCAVVPHPNAEQLADIAIASAKTYTIFINDEPRVALLSFSTRGSAKDETVRTIRQAVEMLKQRAPGLKVDGEIQADAALDPRIAERKIAHNTSSVAGRANVLIFPDLNAGNIAYKLTQRLARADTIGPILQGLRGVLNDLSRGCSVDDIVKNVLVTSVQAQGCNYDT